MTERIQHYLLVFDHDAGVLTDLQEFAVDSDAAAAAYPAKEQELRDRPAIEIVLIGSDSIKTVRLTHANYFNGSVAVSKYLAGI